MIKSVLTLKAPSFAPVSQGSNCLLTEEVVWVSFLLLMKSRKFNGLYKV